MGWQEEDRGDGRRTWVGCDSGDKMKLDKSGVHLGDGIAKAWQETAYADGSLSGWNVCTHCLVWSSCTYSSR